MNSIALDDGRVLRSDYRQFGRGYAVTVYASQGKTVDYVLFSDRRGQLRIGTGADARLRVFPAIVARPAYVERGAHSGQGMFLIHGFDALLAGRGTSERMPSVF